MQEAVTTPWVGDKVFGIISYLMKRRNAVTRNLQLDMRTQQPPDAKFALSAAPACLNDSSLIWMPHSLWCLLKWIIQIYQDL